MGPTTDITMTTIVVLAIFLSPVAFGIVYYFVRKYRHKAHYRRLEASLPTPTEEKIQVRVNVSAEAAIRDGRNLQEQGERLARDIVSGRLPTSDWPDEATTDRGIVGGASRPMLMTPTMGAQRTKKR